MPIYEWKCPRCSHPITMLSPRLPEMPPTCGFCKVSMDRVPSAAAFTVKGFNEQNGYGSR